MKTYDELQYRIDADTPAAFWNVMKGNNNQSGKIEKLINTATGAPIFPPEDYYKYEAAVKEKSIFRNIATFLTAYRSTTRIYARHTDDLAMWVSEGGEIPIYDGTDDFTKYTVEGHKLAAFVKLDNDFIHDVDFDLADYLMYRLSRNFARAEDDGFINGTGENMPTGILHETEGAKVGVTSDSITFDNIINLYFSLDEEYRDRAVWMMNDETALAIRLLKDSDGNYLWNQATDTILGKKVIISNFMPSAESGKMPIVFGDFKYYWVVARTPVSVQPLFEKFITQEQIGYLAFEFMDGMLIDRNAIKALKIASETKTE